MPSERKLVDLGGELVDRELELAGHREISSRRPVPGFTNSGKMKSLGARLVSRTIERMVSLARMRRGR